MKVILIGEEHSKRTDYFRQAAEQQGVPFAFFLWNQWKMEDLEGGIVKIDPLSYDTCHLLDLNRIIAEYRDQLKRLAETGPEIRFLNHPAGILKALNKAVSKKLLQERELPVTELLGENPKDFSELRQIMEEHRAWSVFVKPVYGSGAAGVLALSMQPATGKVAAYTSACNSAGKLVQQKKIRRITDSEEVAQILDRILQLDTVVERWHPKAVSGGESFDFRVLWQFGRVEYLVARKSVMPITNLHLNNHAAMPEEIFTSDLLWNREQVLAEIEDLCKQAMQSFPELCMAGLDIMLDKKTGKPRIIEINGQGDLLYADIYGENRIYGAQIRRMAKGEGVVWNGTWI